MKTKIFTLSGLLVAVLGFGQQNFWSKANRVPTENLKPRITQPNDFKIYQLNLDKIKQDLKAAPQRASADRSHLMTFPDADGKFRTYIVQEASVMSPELQEKYPDLRSYVGWDKNNAQNSIRFSVTPEGLSAMYFDGWDVSYLDSYTADNSQYIMYKRKDLPLNTRMFECHVEDLLDEQQASPAATSTPMISDGFMRTYRLAMAATGEYTVYHGGTVAKAMTAITAAMTRVNGLYEKTFSVTMVLIPNNDLLIYTNPNTDPYTNNDGFAMLSENQTNINNVIGAANYDVGHVFSTGGGGVAALGSICTNSKARGVTGLPSPIGDPFYIDYVAHEMGHQFGANHTFNGTTGNCGGGNRNLPTAFEPGSGSTVMAYAGICGANNVQNNSDPYFHSASVNEVNNVLKRGSDCSVKTPNNNGVPVADAGNNYTIPKGTAFVLTGSATDPDNDPVTYLWEQLNNQNSTQPPVSTSTVGPVYRTYLPTTSPSRYFPMLSSVVANNLTPKWEVTPSVARTLNFSLLVSDNKATGNQSARSVMAVTVSDAGPFKVTSQASNTQFTGGEPMTVTWDVAGTDAAPVNTQNVSIILSKNNGGAFDTVLATGVPNNGSASVILPNEDVNFARVMVKSEGNIYYAINSSIFSIKKSLATVESNTKNFAIYPNPAKHEVNVVLKNKSESAVYAIYDSTGRLVSKGALAQDGKVNVEKLINGNYILSIETKNGEKHSEKLMIKK